MSDKKIGNYRDLITWQKAIAIGLRIYDATRGFPEQERFGLTSQLRRGAISVASNIAEGYGRGSRTEYLRFLKIARGCLFEIDTQLLFAIKLQYLDQATHESLEADVNECIRILAGLIRSLKQPT